MKLTFALLAAFWLTGETLFSQPADMRTLTVRVQTPEGTPVANATVVCADGSTNVLLEGTMIEGGSQRFQTDAQGRFTFEPQTTNYIFMLSMDEGFGLAQSRDLTNHPVMIVQPWGHIEGSRMNRGRPVAGRGMMVMLDRLCLAPEGPEIYQQVDADIQTTTDSQGHFVFKRVPPEGIGILEESPSTKIWSSLLHAQVKPGENKSFQISTDGRTIVGQLKLDDNLPRDLDLTNCDVDLIPANDVHGIIPAIPKEFDTPEKRTQWWEDWYQSKEGREIFRPVGQRGANFAVQTNGNLTSDVIVEPGKYWMSGELRQGRKKVAKVDQYVEIPADPPGDTNEIFDICSVLLKPALQTGSPVPDFDVPTLDGQRLKLSDFRGKYVLLDFWATWCGPCVAETPNIKATYATHGQDDRLVMISLSLDADMAAPKKYVKDNDIHWPQGFLGDWGQDRVTKDLEVAYIPSIWLIGPDGKIIARGLRGPKIEKAVAKALAAK